jgi:hypothetical protein
VQKSLSRVNFLSVLTSYCATRSTTPNSGTESSKWMSPELTSWPQVPVIVSGRPACGRRLRDM